MKYRPSRTNKTRPPKRIPAKKAAGVPHRAGKIRIVRYLAACGIASRRKAADIVLEKRVKVNGQIVTDLSYGVDTRQDQVTVDGERLREVELGLLLFYKPRLVLSTLSDPHGRKSVGSYLTSHFRSYVPVGRLDYESEGLMILTNDGDLANVLLHPKFELDRTYEVTCPMYVSDGQLRKLEQGVQLEDGPARAELRMTHRTPERTVVEVSIREGRNRQVRRMFAAVDAEISSLKRLRHGPFSIGALRPGQIRKLNEREFSKLREKVLSANERPRAGKTFRKAPRRP